MRQPPTAISVLVDRFPVLSETFVASEALALRRLGIDVAVEAATAGDGPAPEPALPVRVVAQERLGERLVALAWLVGRHPVACARDLRDRRRWRREEPVVPLRALAVRARRARGRHLHAHFAMGAALDALRIARLVDTTWSVTAHAYDIYLRPTNLREKLRAADVVTSGCAYTVADLRRIAGPDAADRVHVVVMGVDPRRFARRGPLPGTRRVVAVGRLVEKKGFADLVRAMALVPDAELELVGDGPLRPELEALAGPGVRLVGARPPEGVREALEHADLLAMPCVVAADGDRDSMPVVVKEAMAMERLVVATDEVGLPELVAPPFGRLVPPRDPAALAAAIRELLDLPPDVRAAAGRLARERVLEVADVHREARKLARLVVPAALEEGCSGPDEPAQGVGPLG